MTDVQNGKDSLMASTIPDARQPLRVLVAIASYGVGNDDYLRRLIVEYRSMPFQIDILVLSNINKHVADGVDVVVGLPNKNPWSLPFAHKKIFVEKIDNYDLFIYSEDDILITENNVRAFLDVNSVLNENEIPGFLRFEVDSGGNLNYPDAHWRYHWDPATVTNRGAFTLAKFTNEHAACYLITQAQLRKAIKSGGFDVEPHEKEYDLLCTAATDPYTQCGLTKLIPVSHLDAFIVHHMSNKYVAKMGVDEAEFERQIAELVRIADEKKEVTPLVETKTNIFHGLYSKDYYEPEHQAVISLASEYAQSALSIGCGQGATEIALTRVGLSVAAVPLDPVICRRAAEAGVEIIEGDLRSARQRLEGRRFDCLLLLNVLHLIRDPAEALSAFSALLSPSAPVIIASPNMLSLPSIARQIRNGRIETPGGFERSGAHFAGRSSIAKWCEKAGLNVVKTIGLLHPRVEAFDGMVPAPARLALSSEIIVVARRAG
jgi:SAM-dependent methyltransferase